MPDKSTAKRPPLNPPPPSSGGGSANDLIDKPIVVTDVKGVEQVETASYGVVPAVRADVLVLAGFPGEEDLTSVEGVLFFWQVVSEQLTSEDLVLPTAGKIVKAGKAYVFQPLSPEEQATVERLF
jgi:hypothetical protein